MPKKDSLRFIMNNGKNRYCNVRCHDALKKPCMCVCGGINHGVGSYLATGNIQALLDQKDDIGFSTIFVRMIQLQLFLTKSVD
ncbi:hypothetical protein LCGC14_2491910 [marine sediment metagenome]|uniref:Uncharacterized protein n=1 Tax=marine sediment metagenome TaxID=412755 RepID=A0A0F9DGC5_9ZZZZ